MSVGHEVSKGSPMQILLQQNATGKFLTQAGEWSSDLENARNFHHILELVTFAHELLLVEGPCRIYCAFPDRQYDFAIDLQGARLAAAGPDLPAGSLSEVQAKRLDR